MLPTSFKVRLKKIRSMGTFYLPKRSLEHLENIRMNELDMVVDLYSIKGRVLEIGGGTGWQARELEKRAIDVASIDILASNLKNNRVWPVTDYDGHNIPFADNSFDMIFSSNTLEHIPHVYAFQNEIQRVLKPNGTAIHVLPSSSWRVWSNFTEMVRCWRFPLVHGEHSKNALTEIYHFSQKSWVTIFTKTGWSIELIKPSGLFYTGNSIMDSRLNITCREKLSKVMGSACNVFILKKEHK